MGQTLGRAPLLPAPRHFSNLPKQMIYNLWSKFQDSAEGLGLTQDEFLGILRECLSGYLEYSAKKLDQIGKAVFTILDDDSNDLVDALEFLAAFAVMSAMNATEKARFVFGAFDLDESGTIEPDEAMMAFRATVSGLCKLSAIDPPSEEELERVASMVFLRNSGPGPRNPPQAAPFATLSEFVTFCEACPEVSSWVAYYSDLDEHGVPALLPEDLDDQCALLVLHGGRAVRRSGPEYAAMDLDTGGGASAGIEDRGLASDICQQKPWQSTVVPYTVPTDAPGVLSDAAPDAHLELEWVHGLNTKQGRQCVGYTGRGELVYPAGALGVVYDLNLGKQRFMNGHTDQVTCLRVFVGPSHAVQGDDLAVTGGLTSAPVTLVASGESGRVPKVLVWSPGSPTETPSILASLKGFHKDGVSQLAWCPKGERIVTVGASAFHCVAVYNWRAQELLFCALGSEHPVLDCCWSSPTAFVTCGVNHVHFWTQLETGDPRHRVSLQSGGAKGHRPPPPGQANTKKPPPKQAPGGEAGPSSHAVAFGKTRGLFGKKAASQPLFCARPFGPTLVVTGGGSGHLLVWEGRSCLRMVKGHNGARGHQTTPPCDCNCLVRLMHATHAATTSCNIHRGDHGYARDWRQEGRSSAARPGRGACYRLLGREAPAMEHPA